MSLRVGAAFVILLGTGTARAGNDAECSYLELSATAGKTPAIDAELKPLEKKLKKPPFSSWNEFHKLSSGEFPLVRLKSEPLKLKEGAASVLLRDRSEKRIELTIAVDGIDGKRVLDTKSSLPAGDWVLFGNNNKDDGHILALTCK